MAALPNIVRRSALMTPAGLASHSSRQRLPTTTTTVGLVSNLRASNQVTQSPEMRCCTGAGVHNRRSSGLPSASSQQDLDTARCQTNHEPNLFG
jgi:hypothetical protein